MGSTGPSPRRAPRPLTFDLDGTLFTAGDAKVDFEDPDSVRRLTPPHVEACRLVARLAQVGHPIVYLTARTHILRAVTAEQIQAARLPVGELVTAQTWAGLGAMVVYKAEELARRRALLYVGDMPEDEIAAKRAGVPFLPADKFRAGMVPPWLHPVRRRPEPWGRRA